MIKPLADRVLIEAKEAETKTASGLIIPDTAKEKPQQGTVIAVGNGKTSAVRYHILLDLAVVGIDSHFVNAGNFALRNVSDTRNVAHYSGFLR